MSVESQNLEAHVELCKERYESLDRRLNTIEEKVSHIHLDIQNGNKSTLKIIIASTGTIIAGLLSTIVVLLMKF